jgi:hypothetical protein
VSSVLVALVVGAACQREQPPARPPPAPATTPPPAVAAVVDAGEAPDAGPPVERCDASKKPRRPAVDVSTPKACRAAAGRWEVPRPADAKRWKGYVDGPRGSGDPLPQFHCEPRRGPPLCVRILPGCANVPSTDEGAACRYDWDCQGSCTEKGCSRSLEHSEYGCQTRCVDGVVVRGLCVD